MNEELREYGFISRSPASGGGLRNEALEANKQLEKSLAQTQANRELANSLAMTGESIKDIKELTELTKFVRNIVEEILDAFNRYYTKLDVIVDVGIMGTAGIEIRANSYQVMVNAKEKNKRDTR